MSTIDRPGLVAAYNEMVRECAALRDRAERAEAERDEARRERDRKEDQRLVFEDQLNRRLRDLQEQNDDIARLRVRVGQLREAIEELLAGDWIPPHVAGALATLLSSPPDAPDVLGAVRVLNEALILIPFAILKPETTQRVRDALATLRAAGVLI